MKLVWAFFTLIRSFNLLIIAFTQYMIKFFLIDSKQLSIEQSLFNIELFLVSFSTICIAAAGYIINDYYDIKIDTINKPHKVIIGVYISRRGAILWNFALNVIGLGIAYWLSKQLFLVHLGAGVLLWFYSNYLKRTALLGNVVIGFLTAVSVLVMAVQYPQNQELVGVFALFAFFITIVREIIKDIEDVKGDATFGCRTLPIIWGIRRAKRVIYVFFVIFSIILLSTYFSFHQRFVFYLYFVLLPLWGYFFVRLVRADTKKEFAFLSAFCKWIMILGVLSMFFL
ncbi:MAG: geranylgeranylglycerol-phosphate geranylgeranyltransferase [Microscillaceae bacterium]|nr:geranylgeranylglycerol-phosphate geranylgeranyltransferase [Microscillaceae bacterium]MDW8459901.1 geranylgeranylglycerol-phosphate geranylgeranyltransferase [Cytophagales bacterium]